MPLITNFFNSMALHYNRILGFNNHVAVRILTHLRPGDATHHKKIQQYGPAVPQGSIDLNHHVNVTIALGHFLSYAMQPMTEYISSTALRRETNTVPTFVMYNAMFVMQCDVCTASVPSHPDGIVKQLACRY